MNATLTVVLAPSGQVSQWIREEMAVLIRAGLCHNHWWWTGGSADDPTVASVIGADGAVGGDPDRSLFEVTARAAERLTLLRVIRLVPAGADPHVIDPHELQARLLQVLDPLPVVYLNLLVPTEDTVESATVSAESLVPGWVNLVVSPEDRASALAQPETIEVGPRYAAHVAASLASVSGAWVAMPDAAPFDDADPIDAPGDIGRPGVIVLRSRSRSLLFGRVADSVAARALHSPPPGRPSFSEDRPAEPYGDPDALTTNAAAEFVDLHETDLCFHITPPEEPETKRYVGFLGVLRMIWDFVRRRLPEIVRSRARGSLDDAVAGVEKKIEARILGDESAFELKLFPGSVEGEPVRREDEVRSALREYTAGSYDFPFTPPVDAWTQMGPTCTGLFDAGPVPLPHTNEALRTSGRTRVVREPARVVGPLGGAPPTWECPEAVAVLIGWDPLAWRRGDARYARTVRERLALLAESDDRPSDLDDQALGALIVSFDRAFEPWEKAFVWKVAAKLSDELDEAIATFRLIEELLRPKTATQTEPPRLRKGFRRVLLWAVLLLAATALSAVLPIAAPLFLGIVISMGLVWAGVTVGTILGWVRSRWLESVRRRHGEALALWASDNKYHVLASISALNGNYAQLLDWIEIIGQVFDEPFGPPAVHSGELDPSEARTLLSHQIAAGDLSSEAFNGAVGRSARMLYRAGWLGDVLSELTDRAMKAYKGRTGLESEAIDPPPADRVVTADRSAIEAQSTRLYLLDHVRRGSSRFEIRVLRWEQVRRMLGSGPMAQIIDRVDGYERSAGSMTVPEAFLHEAMEVSPGMGMLRAVWANEVPPAEAQMRALLYGPEGVVPAKAEAPVVAAHVSEPNPDVLLFQALAVDSIGPVDVEEIQVIGLGPAAAVDPDLLRPDDRLTAQPLPSVDPAELARRKRSHLRPLDDFQEGTVIEPTGDVVEPPDSGRHEFLMEVDGTPYLYPMDRATPFMVREVGGPPNGLELVREALQAISDVSGLRFIYEGLTTEMPGEEARRSPRLWIGWVFPEEQERFLTETIVGLGGPRGRFESSDAGHITGGLATVKADLDLPAEHGPATIGAILMHELGHALNLGHVDSTAEVMYPSLSHEGPAMLGPGDTRGLWLLGAGRHLLLSAPTSDPED